MQEIDKIIEEEKAKRAFIIEAGAKLIEAGWGSIDAVVLAAKIWKSQKEIENHKDREDDK